MTGTFRAGAGEKGRDRLKRGVDFRECETQVERHDPDVVAGNPVAGALRAFVGLGVDENPRNESGVAPVHVFDIGKQLVDMGGVPGGLAEPLLEDILVELGVEDHPPAARQMQGA